MMKCISDIIELC